MRHVLIRGLFASLIALAGCAGQGTVANTPSGTVPTYVPAALAHVSVPRAPMFARPRSPDSAMRASRNDSSTGHYPFFSGEAALSNGVYYLAFSDGDYFGYYSYLTDARYIYHFDLGYEYTFDANDGRGDIYFYDFTSGHFWYTGPTLFPYLYDFSLQTFVYYYQGSSNPRYFYDFATNSWVAM